MRIRTNRFVKLHLIFTLNALFFRRVGILNQFLHLRFKTYVQKQQKRSPISVYVLAVVRGLIRKRRFSRLSRRPVFPDFN